MPHQSPKNKKDFYLNLHAYLQKTDILIGKRHHLKKERQMSINSEAKPVHSLSAESTAKEVDAYWENYYGISAAEVLKQACENHEANRRALVARMAGVDVETAKRLGY